MSVQNSDGIRQPFFMQLRGDAVLEPIRETAKVPCRTTKHPTFLQNNDKFHTLPPTRQDTLLVIFEELLQQHSPDTAKRWLERQLLSKTGGLLDHACLSSRLETSTLDHEPRQNPLVNALSSPERAFVNKWVAKSAETPRQAFGPPVALSEEQVASLRPLLSPTELRCLRLLREAAQNVAKARAYSPQVSCVTFFCPQEIVVKALGVVRSTVWRAIQTLKSLGLVDACEWKTDLKGNTRNGGYLWKVKLDPLSPIRPRLSIEEFKHRWRDLNADVDQGRTAFNWLHQSLSQEECQEGCALILGWALPPSNTKNLPLPSNGLTDADQKVVRVYNLESILDLPAAARSDRNQMVNLTARAIGQCLGDTGSVSLMFYRRVLWNLLRQFDQGNDWFGSFYDFTTRARADFSEGWAKRAGALLVSRLKQWHLWPVLETTAPYSVATGGLQA